MRKSFTVSLRVGKEELFAKNQKVIEKERERERTESGRGGKARQRHRYIYICIKHNQKTLLTSV